MNIKSDKTTKINQDISSQLSRTEDYIGKIKEKRLELGLLSLLLAIDLDDEKFHAELILFQLAKMSKLFHRHD